MRSITEKMMNPPKTKGEKILQLQVLSILKQEEQLDNWALKYAQLITSREHCRKMNLNGKVFYMPPPERIALAKKIIRRDTLHLSHPDVTSGVECSVCKGTGDICQVCEGDCYDGPNRLCEWAGEGGHECENCDGTGRIPLL